MGFKLTIEQGKGRGQSFDFDAPEVTIGRTDENDVVLFDGGVSRQHAKISFDGARWTVSDMDSANGTTLNGARIATEVLENGDQIGIGQAVFRFEAAPTGASTRIVSLADAEKAVASKKSSGRGAASQPPPVGADPKVVRAAALGGLALVALVLFGVVWQHHKTAGLTECPSGLDFSPQNSAAVFGRGVDADCQAPSSGLSFWFAGTAHTRYLLHYAPFFVHGDELAIVVNGQKVATAPAAPGRKSDRQVLTIPDGAVKVGDNTVVFRDLKGSDATWGVERVELESIPLAAADLRKAEDARQIGEKLYEQKNVAAPNLYNAWVELREARKYYEGLPTKPITYQATIQNISHIEKELDKLCKKQLFAAQQDAMYGKYEQANEAYQFIMAAFPGDLHPCRAEAQERLQSVAGAR